MSEHEHPFIDWAWARELAKCSKCGRIDDLRHDLARCHLRLLPIPLPLLMLGSAEWRHARWR